MLDPGGRKRRLPSECPAAPRPCPPSVAGRKPPERWGRFPWSGAAAPVCSPGSSTHGMRLVVFPGPALSRRDVIRPAAQTAHVSCELDILDEFLATHRRVGGMQKSL